MGIEAFISPPYHGPAFKGYNAGDLGCLFDYTMIWNVLHYPSGVVPITQVQPGEEVYEDSYNDMWTSYIKEDLKGSVGMPMCVQVVSYFGDDEICLGLMKTIEDKIKFNKLPNIW